MSRKCQLVKIGFSLSADIVWTAASPVVKDAAGTFRRLADALRSGAWLSSRSGSSVDSMEAGLRTIYLGDPLMDGFRDEIASWLEERE